MPSTRAARTRIQRLGSRRARDLRTSVAAQARRAREDAGLSQRALARDAGVSSAAIHSLERGTHDPSTEVLARVATALGMDLSVRLYPGSEPLIHDHIQAAMIEAPFGSLHERWRPSPEVPVYRPVRGVIDLVLDAADEPLIACEAQSDLRRLEQQLRWSQAKAEALAEARRRPVSRLLLLRSTRRRRAIVGEYAATIRAAFPGPTAKAHAALPETRPWSGDSIVWCAVTRGQARVMGIPPRSVRIGR